MRIDLHQNTRPWEAWRGTGLGGSDANIIWAGTEREVERLVFEKAHLVEPESIPPFAKNLGAKYEPYIRKAVEQATSLDFPAMCFSHDIVPWMHASVDGFGVGGEPMIMEAKATGTQLYEQTAMGIVPHLHIAQCLHNMMCADVPQCLYATCDVNSDSFGAESTDVTIMNLWLEDFQEEAALLLLAEHAIWDVACELYAPYDLGDMPVEQRYIAAKAMEAKAKKMVAEARKELMELVGTRASGRVGRVKFAKVETKGSIDTALMHDDGLNVDDYRKESRESYRFTIQKDEEILEEGA